MKSKNLHSVVFKKSFYTYLAVFSMLVSLFGIIYFKFYVKQETNRVVQYYANDAKRVTSALDVLLGELNHLKNNIQYTTWVKKLLTPTDTFSSDFDVLSRIEYQEELSRYAALNNIISDIAIILPQKNLVVSPSAWYTVDEYKSYLGRKTEIDFTELLKIAQTPTDINSLAQINSNIGNNETLVCLQSLDNQQIPMATLILLIDTHKYISQISRIASSDMLGLKLLTNNNEILIEASFHKQEEDCYQTQVESYYINGNYIIYNKNLNVKMIMNRSIYTIILIMVLGTFFTVILLSYFLSTLSYKPLEKLINYISHINGDKALDSKPEYDFIEQSFETLYGQNISMEKKVELYYNAAKNNMLMNLIRGYFQDDDIDAVISQYNMGYANEQSYMVLLIDTLLIQKAEDIAMRNINGVKLITLARKYLSDFHVNFEIIEAVDTEAVVILSFDENLIDEIDLLDMAYQLKNLIFDEIHIPVNVSIGQPYKGFLGISKSYHELKDSIKTNNNDYSFDVFQSQKNTQTYYYPIDWEIQLINSIKSGNIIMTKKIFEEIITENTSRNLEVSVNFRLISFLLETIKRVIYELKMNMSVFNDAIFKIYHYQYDKEMVWTAFYELVVSLCEEVTSLTISQSQSRDSEIIRYVNQNYFEASMSLKELSEKFNMPTYAVSKVFKENSGINFYEYIVSLRMEKAKELFHSVGYDVTYVSKTIGYENEYSFRRAFLKYEHIKPREYVEKIYKEHQNENL